MMNDRLTYTLVFLAAVVILYLLSKFLDWWFADMPDWLRERRAKYSPDAIKVVCEIASMGYHTSPIRHGGIGVVLGNSFAWEGGPHVATQGDANLVGTALQPLAESGWEITGPKPYSFDPGAVIMTAHPPTLSSPPTTPPS